MKNIVARGLISFAVCFFYITHVYAQAVQNKAELINLIRKNFKEITEYKNYKVVTIDDVSKFKGHYTDNGGSLAGYYKNDSLKKIIEWIGLSVDIIQNEYYFNNDKLIFVYSTAKRHHLNDDFSIDETKLDNVSEGRYYFDNNKLIDTILSNEEREKEKGNDVKRFLKDSKSYINLLNSKKGNK